jgi:hypothetical protein
MVFMGRVTTVVLIILAALVALRMNNALQIFEFILMFGAGTGLIFLLRWFWPRINAWSEIAAMFSSGFISFIIVFFDFFPSDWESYWRFPLIVLITTTIWLVVTFLTEPESKETLRNFYRHIQPGGRGWQSVVSHARAEGIEIVDPHAKWTLPSGILAMLAGTILVYSILFGTGKLIFGEPGLASFLYVISAVSAFVLFRYWRKVGQDII